MLLAYAGQQFSRLPDRRFYKKMAKGNNLSIMNGEKEAIRFVGFRTEPESVPLRRWLQVH